MKRRGSGLSDERKDELKKFVEAGMPYSEIAERFRITRNSVSGYANRLGIKSPRGPRGSLREKKPKKSRATGRPRGGYRGVKPPVPGSKKSPVPKPPVPGSKKSPVPKPPVPVKREEKEKPRQGFYAIKWTEHVHPHAACLDCITANGCRWPVRGPAKNEIFQFCGAPKMGQDAHGRETSYCTAHHRMSLRKHEKRGE